MKKQIEIEDSLNERVESAIEEVKALIKRKISEGEDRPSSLGKLDDDGSVHEIVDSSVPIYTSEIRDIWYLHKNELEEAYNNAGVGNNPQENDGMSAIYFFIFDQVCQWLSDEAVDFFDEELEKFQSKQKE